MTKTTVSIIAFCSFLLGFIFSEYRHQKNSDVPRETKSTLTSVQRAEIEHSPVSGQPHNDRVLPQAGLPVQTVNEAREAVSEFSWEKIQQLIALANYDKAIELLQDYLRNNNGSTQAWFLLAHTFEKQGNHEAALEAWFRYLDHEDDVLKREEAIKAMQSYLVKLFETPSLFDENSPWLIAQLDALLELSMNDGELHLLLASLYVQQNDEYQAQYHALMAANDPDMRGRAEDILAQLDGTKIPDQLSIPLIRYGNQYLVNVVIEGHGARLLLDTGASISGVSSHYTGRYPGIVKSTKPIRLNTASGIEDSYLFTIDSLHIEQLVFNQHILALLPMGNMTEFDGLLGVDILGRFDFVIDQDASALHLKARKK